MQRRAGATDLLPVSTASRAEQHLREVLAQARPPLLKVVGRRQAGAGDARPLSPPI